MNNINELFSHLCIGEVISLPERLTDGLMHTMYLVQTTDNKYAVKILNAAIMKRKGVLSHITHSECAALFFRDIAPVISAKEFDDKQIIPFRGDYYIIFDYLDGKSIFPPDIKANHCSQIGDILGKMHNADVKVNGMEKEASNDAMFDWDKYLDMGNELNAFWVNDYSNMIEQIKSWNTSVIKAKKELSANLVISHRDLDPKNVMWQSNKPFLIDWEAAGYVNPYQELLEVLNYWADDGKGGLIKDNFTAILTAYTKHDKLDNVNWDIVIDSGYSIFIGWLNYSFKRALNIEYSSAEDKKIGEEQIVETFVELKQYEQKAVVIKKWIDELV